MVKPNYKLPWWSHQLDKSRRLVKRLHHHHQKYPTENNWRQFQTARRAHWRSCKKANRENWKSFISGSNSQKSATLLSKIVQKKTNSISIGHVKKPDGSLTTSTKDTLTVLTDEHFPANTTNPPTIPSSPLIPMQNIPWITDSLIHQAFHSFGKDKAAGPDELKPILLQNLPSTVISRLSTLYTACITLGYTPSKWRISKIYIPKPGKTNYQETRSFRPISQNPGETHVVGD